MGGSNNSMALLVASVHVVAFLCQGYGLSIPTLYMAGVYIGAYIADTASDAGQVTEENAKFIRNFSFALGGLELIVCCYFFRFGLQPEHFWFLFVVSHIAACVSCFFVAARINRDRPSWGGFSLSRAQPPSASGDGKARSSNQQTGNDGLTEEDRMGML